MSIIAEPDIETTPVVVSAIVEYNATEAALADLRARFGNVLFDVTTAKGDKAARAARMELVTLRTALERKRKEIKAPALERCRQIDAEAQRITAEIVALEKPIDAQITAEEERKETERQAREKAERERVAAIRERIDLFAKLTARAVTMTSAEIDERITRIERMEIGEDYAEFCEEALGARRAAVATLRQLYADVLALEVEQHRVQQEREALERQRAEEAERIRAEREAEEQRMAIARAEEEARMRAEREAKEAELRAQREIQERAAAEERARIAEQARLAAEARAEEERRLQALAQALEQEKAEIAARQRAEREAEEARRHAAEQAQERVREAAPLLFAALNSLWADVEAAQINFPDPPIASEQTIALVEDALASALGE